MAPSTKPTTAAPAAPRARGRRAAKSLTLADYGDQHSAKAALAIRALGLTPTMERIEGYPPEQKGTVIGQDPEPGARLAKGDAVLLQVAAPAPQASEAPAAGPRRRKQRHAERTLSLFDAPPAPQPPVAEPARPAVEPQDFERQAEAVADTRAWPAQSPLAEADGLKDAEAAPQEPSAVGRSLDDEFVVCAEEVLAGRRGPEHWRHSHTGVGVLRRARRHPWLAGSLALLLAVWAIVGAAAALDGQSVQPRAIHQRRLVVARREPHGAAMKLAAHFHRADGLRRGVRHSARTGERRAPRAAAHGALRRVPLAVASPEAAQPAAAAAAPAEEQPRARQTPGAAGEPEQRGGGPFGP